MKKQWFLYIIVGILFGTLDFFYQEYVQGKTSSYLISFVIIWFIWLFPIIPIAIYEAKASGSKFKSSLASMLT